MIVGETIRPVDWIDHGNVVSFTPLNPVVDGHRLFVPKKHFRFPDEEPVTTGSVFETASYWHFKQDSGSYNLIVNAGPFSSQTVLHVHVHVHFVPRFEDDGLKLPWTDQIV